MPLDLPFPFTLPRLFRNPTISNFFLFPLELRNSGVRLYVYLFWGGGVWGVKGMKLCHGVLGFFFED